MNKIIVSDDRYGNSAYKVYNFSPGDYNIGNLVEVQEGKSSRFAVIVERKPDLSALIDVCAECVFKDPNSCASIPCGYVTSDGWFPCIALFTAESILFKSVDSVLEDL